MEQMHPRILGGSCRASCLGRPGAIFVATFCCSSVHVDQLPFAVILYCKQSGGKGTHCPCAAGRYLLTTFYSTSAGLIRCGKSCRLRWANYLRPDLKRGLFSEEEERLILDLHKAIGNR